MPVPAVDADKRGDAYKKVKPVEGIDEQGLVPDPQVMHVLFARLMAILGPLGILPIIFAVNSGHVQWQVECVRSALRTSPRTQTQKHWGNARIAGAHCVLQEQAHRHAWC